MLDVGRHMSHVGPSMFPLIVGRNMLAVKCWTRWASHVGKNNVGRNMSHVGRYMLNLNMSDVTLLT